MGSIVGVGSTVGSASGSPVGFVLKSLEGNGEEGSLGVGYLPVGDSLGFVFGCCDGTVVNVFEGFWDGAPSISSVRVGDELGLALVGDCVCATGGHPGQLGTGALV
jgi:hypothetical protein